MSISGIERLPFVACTQEGSIAQWWAPARTGDYATDCRTGRDYAAALRDFIAESGNAPALPWIVRSMPRGDDFTGVEIGFLTGMVS